MKEYKVTFTGVVFVNDKFEGRDISDEVREELLIAEAVTEFRKGFGLSQGYSVEELN